MKLLKGDYHDHYDHDYHYYYCYYRVDEGAATTFVVDVDRSGRAIRL